jgi:MSHA pilin protein MshB
MKKQQGFTLLELVLVVIILGFLAAAAIPRFITATDDAREASVEGVAGGFASAVGLVRAQWELSGRPDPTANSINYDGQAIYVSATGYPTATGQATSGSQLTSAFCQQALTGALASAPSSVLAGAENNGARYVVSSQNNGFGSNSDACIYTLIESLNINNGSTIPTNTNNNVGSLTGRGFHYNPNSGAVAVFRN